ncbi:MAG: FAD-dependent oxidoreductase [Sulfurimonadaceae bacterium]
MKIYDTAIIGAGINGCSCAYFLSQAKQNVVLIDQDGIASGGSGAAGAFISPKFTKGGRLKELLEEAYLFSLDFYTTNFPEHIQKAKLLQIANSDENEVRLNAFKETTTLSFSEDSSEVEPILTPYAKECTSLVLEEGGVVDAKAMCEALAEGIDFSKEKVKSLHYDDGVWQIGDISAKRIILATGSYDLVVEMPYLQLRRIWGHRIDVKTTTKVPYSIHHHLSISPLSEDGTLAIGATHNLHYNPFGDEVYDVEKGRKELLDKALKSVKLENVKVIKDYVGLRSGSNDYLPIIGKVVDAEKTMDETFKPSKLKKMSDDSFAHFPELYMINGTGGYGFVLAPYLAKQLTEYITDKTELNTELTPTRFFRRWARK